MIEALMLGLIPIANIANCSNAPPVITLNKPKNELLDTLDATAAASTPGTGIAQPTL